MASHIPNTDSTRWLNVREQRAWRGFVRMNAMVQDNLRRQLQRETDLSLADYEVLVSLSESELGALRSYQLGEALQWEASRLSHQLRRMEARGLVVRRSCGEDGRGITTAITVSGRNAIEAAAPLHVAEVRRVFIGALDKKQLDAFAEHAEAVVARLSGVDEPDGSKVATESARTKASRQ